MPPVMASAVSVSGNVIPSRNRYPIERSMTLKSNWPSIRLTQAIFKGSGASSASVPRLDLDRWTDEPGDADLALDTAHAEHDDDVDENINRGGRRERLEH